MTDEVEELLRVLGPFYELIEEKKKISQISDLSTGGFLSAGVTPPPPPLTLLVVVINSTWSLTFYNLPLI